MGEDEDELCFEKGDIISVVPYEDPEDEVNIIIYTPPLPAPPSDILIGNPSLFSGRGMVNWSVGGQQRNISRKLYKENGSMI